MQESIRTYLLRQAFNLFPAYRGSGGRITLISKDFKEVKVKLPLNWRTRNYIGTIYGGSLFGALDPIYMIMLIKLLGPEYRVVDKDARIRFIKTGKETLYAHFKLTDMELAEIKRLLQSEPKIDRVYTIQWLNAAGVVHAECEKTINIRLNSK